MIGIRQRTDTLDNLDKFNAYVVDVVHAFQVVRQILPLPDAPLAGNEPFAWSKVFLVE